MVVGQLLPIASCFIVLVPGQHPFLAVAHVSGGGAAEVVRQFVPASSRLAMLVPGQQLYSFFSQDCSVMAVVFGLVIRRFVVGVCVVFAQLLPSSSRFTISVPGQHPRVEILHLSPTVTVVVVFGGLVAFVGCCLVVTGQLLPASSRCMRSVPRQHP